MEMWLLCVHLYDTVSLRSPRSLSISWLKIIFWLCVCVCHRTVPVFPGGCFFHWLELSFLSLSSLGSSFISNNENTFFIFNNSLENRIKLYSLHFFIITSNQRAQRKNSIAILILLDFVSVCMVQVWGGNVNFFSQIDYWLDRLYNHRENWGEGGFFVKKKEECFQEGLLKEVPLFHRHYRIVLDSWRLKQA